MSTELSWATADLPPSYSPGPSNSEAESRHRQFHNVTAGKFNLTKHPLWRHAFPAPFLTAMVPKHSREDEIPMWGWGVMLSWKEGRWNGRVPHFLHNGAHGQAGRH